VQEGCDLFCTFCIVPMARGASRSLPPREVLAEIRALVEAGFEEVVLTGVHLGGYGADLEPRVDLTLAGRGHRRAGAVPRLRLSSIDPHEVTRAAGPAHGGDARVCPHLHVPLQAGDDGVLRRMRRRYDATLARERLAMIRELLPDAAIGSDVIAGFPGEDEAAFARTLALVDDSPLTYLHVFPYSVRTGTTAAKLDGQNDATVIAGRARRLRALGAEKRARFTRSFAGTEAEVLFEYARERRTGALRGYTRNYIRVHADGPDNWCGRRLRVRLRVDPRGRATSEVSA
jgi:threonylcarbamoyladenosine tRNA methylthiotransferase MtaB